MMEQSVKKMYYKLPHDEFSCYLDKIKNDPETIHFLDQYFYYPNVELQNKAHELSLKQLELDFLISKCTPFQIKKIKESCLINEIHSTNLTENIYSTRSDIFGLMNNVKNIQNKKIKSSLQTYLNLEEMKEYPIAKLSEIRMIYEKMMDGAYESSSDKVDGQYFRKKDVSITNGIKLIHKGISSEEKINASMEEFIQFYHMDLNPYIRIIITHFILETIHPYYDGNGRLGRLLMSLNLYAHTSSLFAYSIATAINSRKRRYYKALESGREIHEFGCINHYVEMMLEILLDEMNQLIMKLHHQLEQVYQYYLLPFSIKLTNSEKMIYNLLVEASIFTYFGISNEEILNITSVSKRTLLSTMKKFRNMNVLSEIQLGKVKYHKIAPEIQK